MKISTLNSLKENRIGLLGGTFDPPHYGHLLIAAEVLAQYQLHEVWFIPNNIPPHKDQLHVVDASHRLKMIKLAIEQNPRFKLSTIELEREGPSYTYDTILSLRSKYKHIQFYFILGTDMVHDLPNWKNIDKLIQMVTFIGVSREGYSFQSPYSKRIKPVEIPLFSVSSTMLRERFKKKGNTRYYLPEKVRKYIEENQLYG